MQSHTEVSSSRTMSVAPHLLVVDDDADVRQMVDDYLTEFDLRVSCAADSRAMREALESGVVDLIVLDLKLNREDGMTIARELRSRSSIPIIMLTSRKDEADHIMGLGRTRRMLHPSFSKISLSPPLFRFEMAAGCLAALTVLFRRNSTGEHKGDTIFFPTQSRSLEFMQIQ